MELSEPVGYPSSEIAHRCEDCGAWRDEDAGPMEDHKPGCIYAPRCPDPEQQ